MCFSRAKYRPDGPSNRHRTRRPCKRTWHGAHTLTALQEFETRLLRGSPPEEKHRGRNQSIGGNHAGDPEKKRYRSLKALRIVPSPSAHCFRLGTERLLQAMRAPAIHHPRWLVPEAQRSRIQRTVSHNRNRRTLEWLLGRIQPRVVGGLLIVLAFVGLLDLADASHRTDPPPIEIPRSSMSR